MRARRPDTNRATAKAVARVTKTTLPKPEDLLGNPELQREYLRLKEAGKRR